MTRSGLLLLVAASTCLAASALASTRPHYGGTLRLAMRDTPPSLDPTDSTQPDSVTRRSLARLLFDTLVVLDGSGRPLPALSTSWLVAPGNQRWQFSIRPGVTFQDGTAVGPDAVAASLRRANPNWKVFPSGDAVVIECSVANANLPAILALTHYAIAKRAGGRLTGSGPFAIAEWDPGKKLVLAAREDYWAGRAFLDGIEIEMGKSFREQMILLDLGKADVIEVAPDQARHAVAEGRRVENSAPAECMALVFARDRQSLEEGKLRRALALSIDRESMNRVLLQGGGELSGALLPDWMTGYAFLFPTAAEMQRAQLTRGEVPQAPAWTLGYDATDPLARVLAERVALNARDAGLRLQAMNSATADLRLVRVPLASLDAQVALAGLASSLGLPQPVFQNGSGNDGDAWDGLYAAELTLLQSQRIIPLLYLRSVAALGAEVRNWGENPDGDWRLENVWLSRTVHP
jgi:ABC-type transport system substrate-binding protein